MHWWKEKREEGREGGTKKGKNQKFFKFNSAGKEMGSVLHTQNKNGFFSLLYILKINFNFKASLPSCYILT